MSPCHNLEPSLVARDSSRLLSVKPNQWTHLSPFYTHMHGEWLRYAKSTSQFHWRFLLVRDDRGFQVNPAGRRILCFCSATFSRKSNFLFLRILRSMGRQCATPCFLTLAHDPLLPAAKRVRFGDNVPPHAPLASPVWDPGRVW